MSFYLLGKEIDDGRNVKQIYRRRKTCAGEEEIAKKFPDEHLMILKTQLNKDEPWYGDYVNYIVGKIMPHALLEMKSMKSWHIVIMDQLGGHHSASITERKVYEARFFCPSIFKNAKDYIIRCDASKRSGNISSRSEMPQNNI
nr:reverse transcriptase domain-containing protein [Tanacetum cinerariifolium]